MSLLSATLSIVPKPGTNSSSIFLDPVHDDPFELDDDSPPPFVSLSCFRNFVIVMKSFKIVMEESARELEVHCKCS